MSLPLASLDKQYEIVAKIKEGGMGEIYKVRHRLLDEIRIAKVLHPELVGDSELRERFAREARAAIQLRHPNIVQIFDFTIDESGVGLIVMEYIRGSDLKQLIAAARLPSVALVIEIARQSLRALGFLHRHGFVHRDVSPDNLMLSRDVEGRPLVKVIDLGIAKRRGSDQQLTASGIFLGKFRYASPEHFGAQGKGGIEARSDLYTFGLVLYELLTGRYPIQGESMSQLIAGHLFQPPYDFTETDPDGRIPESLRRAVLKILAKEPEQRFASADELIAQLESLQAEYPVDAEVLEESRSLIESVPVAEPDAGAAGAPDGAAETPDTPDPADTDAERASAIESLVSEVDDLFRSGQLTAAAGFDRERHEQQEQRAIAEVERRLLARIREQDFAAAREVLARAKDELGEGTDFEPLRRLLVRTLAERIEKLIQEAGLAFEDDRPEIAIERLGEALELDPDNSWIRDRLEQARADQRQKEEEARREQERPAAARSLLDQADAARSGRDVLKARLLVAKALELSPDDEEAKDLARILDREHRDAEVSSWQTTPLSAGLMKAFTDIEALRARGDTLGAWRLLRDSIEEYGEIDTFMKLRRLIAEEILSEDEED